MNFFFMHIKYFLKIYIFASINFSLQETKKSVESKVKRYVFILISFNFKQVSNNTKNQSVKLINSLICQ